MVAYAPIVAGRGQAQAGIVGVESAADQWTAIFWQAAFPHALYLWLVLGLPFCALLLRQRDHEQREALRNLSEAIAAEPVRGDDREPGQPDRVRQCRPVPADRVLPRGS